MPTADDRILPRGFGRCSGSPTAAAAPHANVSYGPHERNVLDVWLAESDQPTPVLFSIHGGGFRGGNKSVDPLLRESTRLTCAAVFNGQASYNPRVIRKLFPENDTYKHSALEQLYGVDLGKLDEAPAEKTKLF